jgi:hypothetical protein
MSFIGIYGQQYGWIAPDQEVSGLEDEYLNAGEMPKLVYVQSPAPDRDPRLSAMLSRIQSDGLSYRGFGTSEELETLIADDLAVLLSERFDLGSEPPEAGRPSRPLPTPASRFIGREREKSMVRDLLTGGDTRIVTLVEQEESARPGWRSRSAQVRALHCRIPEFRTTSIN